MPQTWECHFKIIYLEYQVESLRAWQGKFKVLKDLKISGISGYFFWVIGSIRKDGNDGKLKIWLNSELSYRSFIFEIVTYVFRWKELLKFGLILLSRVSSDSIESTWPLPTCHLVLKFLFWNFKSFKTRPIALKFSLKTIFSYKEPIKGKIFICTSCFIFLNKY